MFFIAESVLHGIRMVVKHRFICAQRIRCLSLRRQSEPCLGQHFEKIKMAASFAGPLSSPAAYPSGQLVTVSGGSMLTPISSIMRCTVIGSIGLSMAFTFFPAQLRLSSLRGHSIRRSRSIGGIHTPYNGNNADGFRASYSRKEGTRLSVSLLGEPQLPLL
jgi:hypothetical protein